MQRDGYQAELDESEWIERTESGLDELEDPGELESFDEIGIDELEFEGQTGEQEHPILRAFRLPAAILGALARGAWSAALGLAVAAGYRDVGALTNVVFYFRHPEVIGRRIRADEKELARDWLRIRDEIVEPTLRGLIRSTPDPVSGPISSSRLRWEGATPEQIAFMRAVFDRHVERSIARGGRFVGSLPESELETIEDGHQAKRDAALAARRLLEAARRDLAGEGLADRYRVGIRSAYRSADRQFEIWQGSTDRGFPAYYRKAIEEGALRAGDHGPGAAATMADFIARWIAAPGFSNHQDGLAIDFGVGTSRGPLGKVTGGWFHRWLVGNASRFGFQPYEPEPWHWVYRGTASAREAAVDSYLESGDGSTARDAEDILSESEEEAEQRVAMEEAEASAWNPDDELVDPGYPTPEAGGPDLSAVTTEYEAESPGPLGLLDRLQDALRRGMWSLAIGLSVASGNRDVNALTNLVFFARHPELKGRKIRADERALADEWRAIRSTIVQPVLDALARGGGGAGAATGTGIPPPGTGTLPPGPNAATTARVRSFDATIDRVAQETGVDGNVIRGIIVAESNGDPNVGRGTAGYKGLMQSGRDDEELRPEVSIRNGTMKFREFRDSMRRRLREVGLDLDATGTEGVLRWVMIAYNAGPATVSRALRYAAAANALPRWADLEFLGRALVQTGAYSTRAALLSRGSPLLALSGDDLALEVGRLSNQDAVTIQQRFRISTGWRIRELRQAIIGHAHREILAHRNRDLTIDAFRASASRWCIYALEFKHRNIPRYVDRIVASFRAFSNP